MNSVPSDSTLMARIADGDQSSLGALYDRHGGMALRVALSIVRDHGRAEDVVQDAFVSVWRKGGSYAPGRGDVRSWLIGIVRNRAIDTLRARRTSEVDDDGVLRSIPDPGPSVADQVVATLEGETVRAAMRKLSREQREAISLAYSGSHTHAEVAAITGLPLGTVHGRIRLGLRHLKAHLLAAGVGLSTDDNVASGAVTAGAPPISQHQQT